jgi:hypothetical protein
MSKINNWKQFLNESYNDITIDKVNQWFEKSHNIRYIESKYPFEICVNDIDIVNKSKDKFENVEVIKIIYSKLQKSVRYHLIFKDWKSISELKTILLEYYDDLIEYGFISNQQVESYRKMSESY